MGWILDLFMGRGDGERLSAADLARDHGTCEFCGGPMGPLRGGLGQSAWGCPNTHPEYGTKAAR